MSRGFSKGELAIGFPPVDAEDCLEHVSGEEEAYRKEGKHKDGEYGNHGETFDMDNSNGGNVSDIGSRNVQTL